MTILLIGIGILGCVLGLFYLKDWLKSPKLARIAYSGLIMRFAVVGAAMIVIGTLLVLDKLFS
ncbi:hypothetical protein N9H39_11685 [Gammaproteobacteria bacterium]|nr:hypothetical protein [Gammaproteobacteria bacterium]